MSSHDPVGSEDTFDGTENGLATFAAGHIQRHMQMLALIHQGSTRRLLKQPSRMLVAETQSLLHDRDLRLGRVA